MHWQFLKYLSTRSGCKVLKYYGIRTYQRADTITVVKLINYLTKDDSFLNLDTNVGRELVKLHQFLTM